MQLGDFYVADRTRSPSPSRTYEQKATRSIGMYRTGCQHTSTATTALDYAVAKYESQRRLQNRGVVCGRSRELAMGDIEHYFALPVNRVSQQRNKRAL